MSLHVSAHRPHEQVHALLEATTHGKDEALGGALFSHADAVTTKYFGNEIYYRGIVEFSNVCTNDCGYCGIRKHMSGVKRYCHKGVSSPSPKNICAHFLASLHCQQHGEINVV